MKSIFVLLGILIQKAYLFYLKSLPYIKKSVSLNKKKKAEVMRDIPVDNIF